MCAGKPGLRLYCCADVAYLSDGSATMAKREKTERFLAELEKRDGPLTEFDEEDWYSLVEFATVYSREDIRFTFKNGMEIRT